MNHQTRAITGMYQSTHIGPLMGESGMIPAKIILDQRQKDHVFRLLCLLDTHPAKDILPLSIRDGDRQNRLDDDFVDKIWATNKKSRTFGQRLSRQVSVRFSIGPSEGVEYMIFIPATDIDGKIMIDNVKLAIKSTRKEFQKLIS